MGAASGEPRVADVLEIVPTYVDEVVLRTVRDTHRAWSRRAHDAVDRATGGAAAVPRALHDGIAEGVYAALGLGLRAASVAARSTRGRGPALAGPVGHTVRSALNGLLGDRLVADGSALAVTMAVRVRGADVVPSREALAPAYPAATGRIAVLLHGLGEHDDHWRARRAVVGSTYAETLAALGWTPVVLRLNTGLSLRENGAALAGLLQDLVDAWPVEPERVALVGHSMGGLVARAACAVATAAERPWSALVSDVVTLGTPHAGADLARVVGLGSRALALLPETAAFGRILDHRSVGIVDLSHGLPDLEPVPGVRYRLVSAALDGPWGALLGDLLVRRASATGRGRRGRHQFPDADLLHLPGAGHFELLNHPSVHDALRRWLGPDHH